MYELLYSSVTLDYGNTVRALKRNGGGLDPYCLWDEVDPWQDVDMCVGTASTGEEAAAWVNQHRAELYVVTCGGEPVDVILTWFTARPEEDDGAEETYTSSAGVRLNDGGVPVLD